MTLDLRTIVRNSAAWRLPGATSLLAAATLIVAALPDSTQAALLFRPREPGLGLAWLTGHFVHVSRSHLFWDLTVFVVLSVMLERRHGAVRFVAVAVSATAGVSLGVVMLRPDLGFYAGLSGLDSALAAWLAGSWLVHRDARRWLGGAMLTGLLMKSGYEMVSADTAFAELAPGVVPVPSAHLVGALIGIVAAARPHIPRFGFQDDARRREQTSRSHAGSIGP